MCGLWVCETRNEHRHTITHTHTHTQHAYKAARSNIYKDKKTRQRRIKLLKCEFELNENAMQCEHLTGRKLTNFTSCPKNGVALIYCWTCAPVLYVGQNAEMNYCQDDQRLLLSVGQLKRSLTLCLALPAAFIWQLNVNHIRLGIMQICLSLCEWTIFYCLGLNSFVSFVFLRSAPVLS